MLPACVEERRSGEEQQRRSRSGAEASSFKPPRRAARPLLLALRLGGGGGCRHRRHEARAPAARGPRSHNDTRLCCSTTTSATRTASASNCTAPATRLERTVYATSPQRLTSRRAAATLAARCATVEGSRQPRSGGGNAPIRTTCAEGSVSGRSSLLCGTPSHALRQPSPVRTVLVRRRSHHHLPRPRQVRLSEPPHSLDEGHEPWGAGAVVLCCLLSGAAAQRASLVLCRRNLAHTWSCP